MKLSPATRFAGSDLGSLFTGGLASHIFYDRGYKVPEADHKTNLYQKVAVNIPVNSPGSSK